jgi:hypothetical protein
MYVGYDPILAPDRILFQGKLALVLFSCLVRYPSSSVSDLSTSVTMVQLPIFSYHNTMHAGTYDDTHYVLLNDYYAPTWCAIFKLAAKAAVSGVRLPSAVKPTLRTRRTSFRNWS